MKVEKTLEEFKKANVLKKSAWKILDDTKKMYKKEYLKFQTILSQSFDTGQLWKQAFDSYNETIYKYDDINRQYNIALKHYKEAQNQYDLNHSFIKNCQRALALKNVMQKRNLKESLNKILVQKKNIYTIALKNLVDKTSTANSIFDNYNEIRKIIYNEEFQFFKARENLYQATVNLLYISSKYLEVAVHVFDIDRIQKK